MNFRDLVVNFSQSISESFKGRKGWSAAVKGRQRDHNGRYAQGISRYRDAVACIPPKTAAERLKGFPLLTLQQRLSARWEEAKTLILDLGAPQLKGVHMFSHVSFRFFQQLSKRTPDYHHTTYYCSTVLLGLYWCSTSLLFILGPGILKNVTCFYFSRRVHHVPLCQSASPPILTEFPTKRGRTRKANRTAY